MKRYINNRLWVLLLLVPLGGIGVAQERITNETKVVVVVNSITNVVDHLELMDTFQKKDKADIFKKYPNHSFYYGLLKGKYELNKQEIRPFDEATISIYTNRQLFPDHPFYATEELMTGDTYRIGETKSKVIANKKGILTIKVEN